MKEFPALPKPQVIGARSLFPMTNFKSIAPASWGASVGTGLHPKAILACSPASGPYMPVWRGGSHDASWSDLSQPAAAGELRAPRASRTAERYIVVRYRVVVSSKYRLRCVLICIRIPPLPSSCRQWRTGAVLGARARFVVLVGSSWCKWVCTPRCK